MTIYCYVLIKSLIERWVFGQDKRGDNYIPLVYTCVHAWVLEMSLDHLIILQWWLCCLKPGQGWWSQTPSVRSVNSLNSAASLTESRSLLKLRMSLLQYGAILSAGKRRRELSPVVQIEMFSFLVLPRKKKIPSPCRQKDSSACFSCVQRGFAASLVLLKANYTKASTEITKSYYLGANIIFPVQNFGRDMTL